MRHTGNRDRVVVLATLKRIKLLEREGCTDLAYAIVAKIKKNHFVIGLQGMQSRQISRSDKLVIVTPVIALLDRGMRRLRGNAIAVHNVIPSKFYSIPALIAIHCVVTP